MLEKEILFIGIGKNKYKTNTILEIKSDKELNDIFDTESCFYKTYQILKSFNKNNMYILNINSWEDINEIAEDINSYDFQYICPLDLYLTDKYYDDYYQKTLLYSQIILYHFGKNISTIIMTGKHASLYDNLDDFLNEENLMIDMANNAFETLHKENFIYVANNLRNFEYANVVLALMLINSDYNEYPSNINIGNAFFDIYYSDVNSKLVYFKNNYSINTSVENLVNFSDDYKRRLVLVNNIIKYFYYHYPIEQEQYIGKSYTEYIKMKLIEELDKYLSNLVGYIIYSYKIIDAVAICNKEGAIEITFKYDIWPKFTQEKYRLENTL